MYIVNHRFYDKQQTLKGCIFVASLELPGKEPFKLFSCDKEIVNNRPFLNVKFMHQKEKAIHSLSRLVDQSLVTNIENLTIAKTTWQPNKEWH